MDSDVTLTDGLKSVLSKCKPGDSKTISVGVSMGKDGKVTLDASGTSEYEDAPDVKVEKTTTAPAPAKKKSSRPKAVAEAITSMY